MRQSIAFVYAAITLFLSACTVHHDPNPLTDHLALTMAQMTAPDASPSDFHKNKALAFEVANTIRTSYLTPIDDQNLIAAIDKWRTARAELDKANAPSDIALGMIRAMTSALDPYSAYLTPQQGRLRSDEYDGKISGIGVLVRRNDLGLEVISPRPGTPGEKAGILPKDIIIKVDGQVIAGMPLDETVEKIRGPVNTSVRLTLLRNTTTLEKKIIRQEVEIDKVQGHLEGRTIVLKITVFHGTTARQVKAKLKDLIKQTPGKPAGIILDLRNNPGGLLRAALSVSEIFLSTGNIVSVEAPRRHSRTNYNASLRDDTGVGLPMVVLVNNGSASASEIVSAALSENGRATLLGEKTFGKGVVQSVIPFPDGAALKLTTERYLTPLGNSIDGTGIKPDVPVKQDEETEADEVLDAGLKRLAGVSGVRK